MGKFGYLEITSENFKTHNEMAAKYLRGDSEEDLERDFGAMARAAFSDRILSARRQEISIARALWRIENLLGAPDPANALLRTPRGEGLWERLSKFPEAGVLFDPNPESGINNDLDMSAGLYFAIIHRIYANRHRLFPADKAGRRDFLRFINKIFIDSHPLLLFTPEDWKRMDGPEILFSGSSRPDNSKEPPLIVRLVYRAEEHREESRGVFDLFSIALDNPKSARFFGNKSRWRHIALDFVRNYMIPCKELVLEDFFAEIPGDKLRLIDLVSSMLNPSTREEKAYRPIREQAQCVQGLLERRDAPQFLAARTWIKGTHVMENLIDAVINVSEYRHNISMTPNPSGTALPASLIRDIKAELKDLILPEHDERLLDICRANPDLFSMLRETLERRGDDALHFVRMFPRCAEAAEIARAAADPGPDVECFI